MVGDFVTTIHGYHHAPGTGQAVAMPGSQLFWLKEKKRLPY